MCGPFSCHQKDNRMNEPPRIGSLFSGAGGLDLAVEAVFGGQTVWHSEIDPAASKVLAHRWPGVPNLGDITAVDWADVPAVDILCGGFPCQDVSAAGKRAGIKDGTRSGLWSVFADAIEALQPRIVVIENVRGLLSATAERTVSDGDSLEFATPGLGNGTGRPVLRAMGAVLGTLSDIGYDAQWATVAAADVGAPHRRERVFIVAANSGGNVLGRGAKRHLEPPAGIEASRWDDADRRAVADGGDHRRAAAVDLLPTPDASATGGHGSRAYCTDRPSRADHQLDLATAIARHVLLPTPQAHDSQGPKTPEQIATMRAKGAGVRNLNETAVHELFSTPQSRDYKGRPADGFNNANLCRDVALLCTPAASDGAGGKTSRSGGRIDEPLLGGQAREMATAWGKYEPAIRRWEQIVGPAPAPTEPNKNGNPRLSAAFSEWLMGWPEGWVTDPAIGISRNDQLRIVGNGVVSIQAVAALRYLLNVAALTA
jgi:DNA (cytosine-5)-methyltransferase 1